MSLVDKWVGNGRKLLKINMAVSVFVPSRERTWKLRNLRNLRWEKLKCELEVDTHCCKQWHTFHDIFDMQWDIWQTRTHPPVRFECITTPPVVSIRHHDSRTNTINSKLFMLIYQKIYTKRNNLKYIITVFKSNR